MTTKQDYISLTKRKSKSLQELVSQQRKDFFRREVQLACLMQIILVILALQNGDWI